MGHSKAAKEKSHRRIVKTAAARFRERGLDGIGLADLMKEADLTHGGFYGHFDSREELAAARPSHRWQAGTTRRQPRFASW